MSRPAHAIRTHPWAEIASRYRDAEWKAPMLALVERIAASRYADGVHAITSMHTLVVGQTRELEWNHDNLRIEPITTGGRITRIRFDYVEYPAAAKHWSRECAPRTPSPSSSASSTSSAGSSSTARPPPDPPDDPTLSLDVDLPPALPVSVERAYVAPDSAKFGDARRIRIGTDAVREGGLRAVSAPVSTDLGETRRLLTR